MTVAWAGLSLIFGAVVGLSLGLTGGGGAIFAVPLLVYGLGVPPRGAVMISLAAVGATSLVGFLHRWKLGEVEIAAGLVFAVAGMLGAPLGTWLAGLVSEATLLLGFAALMLLVAVRLWRQAQATGTGPHACAPGEAEQAPTCRRDAAGRLLLSTRCAALLLLVGIGAGVLAGLFGVGGGFVIVPALVLFSGMAMHRAVGTSLMVIALISASGLSSQIAAGRTIPLGLTSLFVLGGVAGLFAGQRIGCRLSGPALQKVFATAMVAVAVFVVAQNLG